MSTKENTVAGHGARARSIWIVWLALGLMTLALLYCAKSSQALDVEGVPAVNPGESREEPFEELEEAGECEVLEQEAEDNEVPFEDECQEFEEDEEGSGSLPPPECVLRTVNARVFTHSGGDQISLVLGYTSVAPATVTVDYGFKGNKGGLSLGKTTHRFSRQGVFRVNAKLTDSQVKKVQAAKDFAVRVQIPSAPGYCQSYFTRHLSAKRKAHGQVIWYQAK